MTDSEKLALKQAKSLGFDAVEKVGEWEGFEVFDFFDSEDEEGGAIGLPEFILVADQIARKTSTDEAFAIIEALPED